METSAQSASAYSPLENLPLLVLELVCEYLATSDSRRRSLFAFALTSKRCCAISDRERFGRIRLAVEGQNHLAGSLARWDDILRWGERTRYIYVRRMKVVGRMNLAPCEPEIAAETIRAQSFQEENNSDDDDNDGDDEAFTAPRSLAAFVGSDPVITEETKTTRNRLWRPLADFISRCPALKDFVWASSDQVPRCILDTLHSQLPSSRLHVNTFSLRSLYQKRDQLHDIDIDEYALATSPCLFSICVASTGYDTDGNIDYNEEAVLQMVTKSAPNLRSVCMWYQVAGNSMALLDAVRSTRPPWRGFFEGKEDGSQKSQGYLMKLALRGDGGEIFPQRLQNWINHTDFSKLDSLDLSNGVEPDALQILTQMAEDDVFKCLRILSFAPLETLQNLENIWVMANKFLSDLRPLEGIEILGSLETTTKHITSVLDHHGASVQRLCFSGRLDEEAMENLCKGCPNLRDLNLAIKRRQGNKQEVDMYRALGKFPKLERLTLLLDCDELDIFTFNVLQNRKPETERMRSALRNSAIDAHLAQSIFNVISISNRAVQPGITPSFQYLKLRCVCDQRGDTFEQLQRWVARSWICERERADAHSDRAVVREIDVRKRLLIMEDLRTYIEEDFKWCRFGDIFKPTWEAVWPESKGKPNWMEEWHSFPLWQESQHGT